MSTLGLEGETSQGSIREGSINQLDSEVKIMTPHRGHGEDFQSGSESRKQRHRTGVWGMHQGQGGDYGVKDSKVKETGLYSVENLLKQEVCKARVLNLSAVS